MILLTGATGYMGGYLLMELLARQDGPVGVVVRGDADRMVDKLWRGLQLHVDADGFRALLPRLVLLPGDLHHPDLFPDRRVRERALAETTSIVHAAASLNRKSERACLNTNLRGTLAVVEFARAVRDLERFSFVSTVAVAGERAHETVHEDDAIDWDRRDYDPYARTKKFAEHLVRRLLPDVRTLVFRPAMMIGDGRHPRTTQFDMVRAVAGLADLPVLPFRETDRFDIVNTAWAAEVLVRVHLDPDPAFDTIHLSAGAASPTAAALRDAFAAAGRRPFRLVPRLARPFDLAIRAMDRAPRGTALAAAGGLMKVFWPYVTYDTVFDNARAVSVAGPPVPFTSYAPALVAWCKAHRFRYPYVDLPPEVG